ncbi:MAG: UDP-glucose 4-epimerase [Rhodospirillales bacterium]|nr:UDP-glucose 4-epimerase [Rhodospirillales bacterium]
MNTILVTGAAGFIGSHAILALLEAGYTVIAIDDLSTGQRWAVPPEITFIQGDVGDAALMRDIFAKLPIDAVMHFAGSIEVGESVSHPLAYYRNNTGGSLTLIEAAIAAGIERMVFSSTAAVYGEPEVQPILEDAATKPINPYGWTKLMTEQMLRDVSAAHGLNYVVLRYFNVSGADPKGRAGESIKKPSHLIKRAVQVAVGVLPELGIYGEDYPTRDGTCVRDYIHVSDLVDAHLLALKHLEGGGKSLTLNCGHGEGISIREVVRAVERATGRPLPVKSAPRRPGDPPTLIAAADRIKALLGWQPRHDLDAMVMSALAWERQLAAAPDGVHPATNG